MGESVNLKCPNGWKLSYDNDTIDAWDDLFTVTCTPLKLYTESEYWPSCVKACKLCLPDPPQHTGLLTITPENTIPIGSHGQYICNDLNFGVDSVLSFRNYPCF